ncbi:DUF1549 and DUF1553 domain-containing protein [Planctomicrobium sp. SH661]|uniref:DUF1549 and DUF1553 domain-containing protein n=1 Tax=Planctomicrobium sp. SH661 TaxID=3448124 RepID=UPI003F5B16F6
MRCASMATVLLLAASGDGLGADPQELARSIDSHLSTRLASGKIEPAARVDDSLFLRRVSLDLIGRIPTPEEVTAFVAEQNEAKRAAVVDRLLASREHASHFARTWRQLLVPESETDRQLRYYIPGFESWLIERRQAQVGFDEIVNELLSVPINGTKERPQLVLTDLKAANPVAYIAAKNADAAALASSTTRLFLGIRLECAQCHDHPFDQWTQHQFWNQAAFFSGIERKGKGAFAPILEQRDRRSISVMSTDVLVPALYLDGVDPDFSEDLPPRVALANWITAPDNPFFARAIANRLWGELLGRGLVDPVDDMHASNPPSHPELLDLLAMSFKDSGFDLGDLYRAICLSDAYQRESRLTAPGQSDSALFARREIKPMTGDQFYDSLSIAIGVESRAGERARGEDAMRRRIVELFDSHGSTRDPETSVVQALTLMNGGLVAREVSPDSSNRLKQLLANRELTGNGRIDQLFLATFSRYPTSSERDQMLTFLQTGPEEESSRRLGDLLWVLLNSPEFRWNH